MAKMLSQQLMGKHVDGIWHTSTVCFGKEYYFGAGIMSCIPGQSGHGSPVQVFDMGETQIPQDVFEEYLDSLRLHWTAEKYHLLDNNCNNFSNELSQFLTGQGIPDWVTGLPAEFMQTPLGRQLRPAIDAMFGRAPTDSWNDMERTVEPAPSSIVTVTSSQQLADVVSRPAVCVFFTSATCPPCRMIEPHFVNLVQEVNRDYIPAGAPRAHQDWIVGAKVDVKNSPAVAAQHKITATPTWILFKHGVPFYEFKGANQGELDTSVRSLVHQVWPRHKHASLKLSSLESMGGQVYHYPVPDAAKVRAKLETFVDGLLDSTEKSSLANPSDKQWKALEKLLDKLPVENAFPLLDTIRIHFTEFQNNPKMFAALKRFTAEPAPKPTHLTALKLACQLPPSLLLSNQHRSITTAMLVESLLSTDAQIRQAAASLAWNVALAEAANKQGSHVAHSPAFEIAIGPDHDEWVVEIVSALITSLAQELEPEVALRLLGALGNLIKFGSEQTLELVRLLEFNAKPEWSAETSQRSDKIKGLVADIHSMTK